MEVEYWILACRLLVKGWAYTKKTFSFAGNHQ